MLTIEKSGNTVIIDNGEEIYAFPVNTLIAISMNDSDTVTLRLKGNRKNLISFLYNEVTNIPSTNVKELIEGLSTILYS